MRAQEAREIANQKAITIGDVLKEIKNSAEQHGATCHVFPLNRAMEDGLINVLLSLGYTIREHTDPFGGFKSWIITW